MDGVERISIATDFIRIGNFENEDSLRIFYQLADYEAVLIEPLEVSFDPQETPTSCENSIIQISGQIALSRH